MPSEPLLGQIMLTGHNFAPRGWALCNGQILSISQNSALFTLLGTQFGGNGTTTFALPNLNGRIPIGQGQGPGLNTYVQGNLGGSASVTLLTTEMPQHNHTIGGNLQGVNQEANNANANGNTIGNTNGLSAAGGTVYANSFNTATPNTNMAGDSLTAGQVGIGGGSQPHNNMQPYLGLTYVIALEGIYPSRP